MTTLLSIFNRLSEDTLFNYYQALYWYCNHNHEGQFTDLYSILSTLPYKPSLTETSDNCDYDILFDLDNKTLNASLLATALRLWSVVQGEADDDKDLKFAKLHYVETMDLYLAEYHDFDADSTEYDTYYMVYSISGNTICNETFPPVA